VTAQSSDTATLTGPQGTDLLTLIRPLEIISKLPGLRRVPFDTILNVETTATGANWVGEGRPAPLTKAVLARLLQLVPLKVVALAVITEELAKSSTPNAESALSRDFTEACVMASDVAFIDPGNGGIAGTKPPSITYGAPAFASGGATALLVDADLGRMIEALIAAGSDLRFAAWVIHPVTAAFLARLRNANGDYAYPGVTVFGGVLMGLPVVVSASVPHGGSPSIGSIVLVDGSRVWLAEDSAMAFDASRSATLQMADNPTNDVMTPTPTTQTSMFQTNSVALRGVRAMNWRIAAPGFAAVLNGLAD
jgi:HK97 family phage major capsid protein